MTIIARAVGREMNQEMNRESEYACVLLDALIGLL